MTCGGCVDDLTVSRVRVFIQSSDGRRESSRLTRVTEKFEIIGARLIEIRDFRDAGVKNAKGGYANSSVSLGKGNSVTC